MMIKKITGIILLLLILLLSTFAQSPENEQKQKIEDGLRSNIVFSLIEDYALHLRKFTQPAEIEEIEKKFYFSLCADYSFKKNIDYRFLQYQQVTPPELLLAFDYSDVQQKIIRATSDLLYFCLEGSYCSAFLADFYLTMRLLEYPEYKEMNPLARWVCRDLARAIVINGFILGLHIICFEHLKKTDKTLGYIVLIVMNVAKFYAVYNNWMLYKDLKKN